METLLRDVGWGTAISQLPVDIQLLNVENRTSRVLVNYIQKCSDGSKKVCRRDVKWLGGYYGCQIPKPILSAEFLGKVYCGILKSDCRLLFVIKLQDGTVRLIQAREGSGESLKLFQYV